MRRAARYLKGRHDFSAFKDRGDEKESHVREVKRLSVKREGPLLRIEIEANGFLRHMVRIIVGTLIEAGRKKIRPQAVREILQSKDRTKAGPTAKALGLTLVRVKY
jgi:tRNA pseudouridine38-40 synthase